MTAIAAILMHTHQVIVSDMMISIPMQPETEHHVFLPTGLTPLDLGANRKPSAFSQKTVIINPYLVLAWAGPLTFGSSAYKFLRDNYSDCFDFDNDKIDQIVEQLTLACPDNGAFFISTFNPKSKRLTLRQVGAWWGAIPDVCDMMLAGSGSAHLYEAAEQLGPLPHGGALGWALTLVAKMIDREVVSGTSTASSYGAAWDVTYLTGSGFQKIDPIIYSQWFLEDDVIGYTYSLQTLFGSKSFGSRQSIKSVVENIDGNLCFFYCDSLPPDQTILEQGYEEPADFPLDSPNQVIAFRYRTPAGEARIIYKVLTGAESDERPFREGESTEDIFEYHLNMKFFDEAYAALTSENWNNFLKNINSDL